MYIAEWEVNPDGVIVWWRTKDIDFTVSYTHSEFEKIAYQMLHMSATLDRIKAGGLIDTEHAVVTQESGVHLLPRS